MTDLEERVIAIAGAGGGLGPIVARTLADAGATLALTDVDTGRLDSLVEQLGLGDDRCDARVADLLGDDGAREWANALEERFGRTDGLLHLVGGWRGGEPLAQAPLSDYEWLHDLLVRTVQHATRAFYEALRESAHGRFVLVSSSQAQTPDRHQRLLRRRRAAASWTLALADQFRAAESVATANILVVNAILTPQMREANPDEVTGPSPRPRRSPTRSPSSAPTRPRR